MVKDKVKSPELEYEEVFEEIAGKDNPPVDTTFLKMIADGDIILTGDLLIELVKESPAYLHTKPIQDRLASWTSEGNRKMLNRIQTALKPERRGRKATKTGGFKPFEILIAYQKNVMLITAFKREHSGKSNRELNKLFKESYPASDINFRVHHSPAELAYDLTTKERNISERTLRKIIKRVRLMPSERIQERIRKPE